MNENIGTIDRTLRILLGLALIGAALGLFGTEYQSLWGWIGALPLATGLVGWCPVYKILGMKTCARGTAPDIR
jgi:hypothetical protein